MTFMQWNDELSIGIAEIDNQHKWLFKLTNDLHSSLEKADVSNDEIEEVLEQLVDYTMNHFIIEEELFERLGYPETAEHKAHHNVFCSNVMDLLLRHDSGEEVTSQMLDMLKNWLLNHICKVDKAYVEHFRAMGANPSPVQSIS